MRREIIISLVVISGVIALYLSLPLIEMPRAAVFPRVVILIMGFLALALLLQNLLIRRKVQKEMVRNPKIDQGNQAQDPGSIFPWKKVISCFGLILLYFIVMESLGFYVSAFLFFLVIVLFLGEEKMTLKKAGGRVGVAFLFTAVLYVLFAVILLVQTPRGILI